METGEFHASGGWMFKRLDDGSVRVRQEVIRHTNDGQTVVRRVEVETTFDPATWASIIGHCSAQGLHDHARAVAFHNDRGTV